MDKEWTVKRITVESNCSKVDRPRVRWEDLGKMEIQNWSKMAVDRETWRRIVKQTRTRKDL
jgi:hypothetical protein